MMPAIGPVLALVGLVGAADRPAAPASYLYQPAYHIDHVLREPAEPYVPQPGDIMLRLDRSSFWRVTHYMALAFDPNGSAIVFARPYGSMGILQSSPMATPSARPPEVEPRLPGYTDIRCG